MADDPDHHHVGLALEEDKPRALELDGLEPLAASRERARERREPLAASKKRRGWQVVCRAPRGGSEWGVARGGGVVRSRAPPSLVSRVARREAVRMPDACSARESSARHAEVAPLPRAGKRGVMFHDNL